MLIAFIVIAFAAGFMAGGFAMTRRLPKLLAAMTGDELHALAGKVEVHRVKA